MEVKGQAAQLGNLYPGECSIALAAYIFLILPG